MDLVLHLGIDLKISNQHVLNNLLVSDLLESIVSSHGNIRTNYRPLIQIPQLYLKIYEPGRGISIGCKC